MIQSFVFLFSHQSATCLVNTNLIDSIIEGPEYFIGSNMSWPNYCSPNVDRKDTYQTFSRELAKLLSDLTHFEQDRINNFLSMLAVNRIPIYAIFGNVLAILIG